MINFISHMTNKMMNKRSMPLWHEIAGAINIFSFVNGKFAISLAIISTFFILVFGIGNVLAQDIPKCTSFADCSPYVCFISDECVACNYLPSQCPGFCNTTSGNCESCASDADCDYNEKCDPISGRCNKLSGACGYARNHTWINYQCCVNASGSYVLGFSCPTGKKCVFNECRDECPFGMEAYSGTCKPNVLMNLSTVLLFILFAVSAAIFMIGSATASHRVTEYAKSLFRTTIENVVIVFIILLLVFWLNDVLGPTISKTKLAFPGEKIDRGITEWTSMQAWSLRYLEGLKNSLGMGGQILLMLSMFAGMIGSMNVIFSLKEVIGLPLQMIFPIGSAFSSVMTFLGLTTTAAGTAIINVELQYQLMRLFGENIFSILLPLGVLFRIFPLTRGAGSALIALSVGFGIILPIGYTISDDIAQKFYVNGRPEIRATHAECNIFWISNPGKDCIGMDNLAGAFLGGMGNTEGYTSWLMSQIDANRVLGKILFMFAVEAFLLPFFIYVMTLNLVRNLAEIMGAHVDL
ncbi:MAG: hypothetical protein QW112_02260, partial [Candidatus Micrarchaeia archaeon]